MEGEILCELKGLPIPPSENHLYKNVPRIGRVKSLEYRAYESDFNSWAWVNLKTLKYARQAISGQMKLGLTIDYRMLHSRIYCKDGRVKKMDVTNRLKILIDLLANALQIDDSAFFSVYCKKTPFNNESVEIAITSFE